VWPFQRIILGSEWACFSLFNLAQFSLEPRVNCHKRFVNKKVVLSAAKQLTVRLVINLHHSFLVESSVELNAQIVAL